MSSKERPLGYARARRCYECRFWEDPPVDLMGHQSSSGVCEVYEFQFAAHKDNVCNEFEAIDKLKAFGLDLADNIDYEPTWEEEFWHDGPLDGTEQAEGGER